MILHGPVWKGSKLHPQDQRKREHRLAVESQEPGWKHGHCRQAVLLPQAGTLSKSCIPSQCSRDRQPCRGPLTTWPQSGDKADNSVFYKLYLKAQKALSKTETVLGCGDFKQSCYQDKREGERLMSSSEAHMCCI